MINNDKLYRALIRAYKAKQMTGKQVNQIIDAYNKKTGELLAEQPQKQQYLKENELNDMVTNQQYFEGISSTYNAPLDEEQYSVENTIRQTENPRKNQKNNIQKMNFQINQYNNLINNLKKQLDTEGLQKAKNERLLTAYNKQHKTSPGNPLIHGVGAVSPGVSTSAIAENITLTTQVADLQNQLNIEQTKVAELQKEIAKLKNDTLMDITIREQKIKDLQDDLDKAGVEIEKLKEEIDKITSTTAIATPTILGEPFNKINLIKFIDMSPDSEKEKIQNSWLGDDSIRISNFIEILLSMSPTYNTMISHDKKIYEASFKRQITQDTGAGKLKKNIVLTWLNKTFKNSSELDKYMKSFNPTPV